MLSSYKGSPYTYLLSCQGASPLAHWKIQTTSGRPVQDQFSHHIQRVYEREIKGYCIHLLSQSIKLEYNLENDTLTSGSHHPFLAMQLYLPHESKKLTIEVTTLDTTESTKRINKRHLFFSTANKELKTTLLHAAIPISSIVTRGEWFSLLLDLQMYTSQLYPTCTYTCMSQVCVTSDKVRLRSVCTMHTPDASPFPLHAPYFTKLHVLASLNHERKAQLTSSSKHLPPPSSSPSPSSTHFSKKKTSPSSSSSCASEVARNDLPPNTSLSVLPAPRLATPRLKQPLGKQQAESAVFPRARDVKRGNVCSALPSSEKEKEGSLESLDDERHHHDETVHCDEKKVSEKEKKEVNNTVYQHENKDHEDEDHDDDESVELVYDDVHQCYLDPLTGKYYHII